MRRRIVLFILICLVTVGLTCQAQDHFALEDLHLLSWQDIPDVGANHLAPVSAAILMAWTAEHGYPELLPDLNGDGRIDEEDTGELAMDFGHAMRTHEPSGVADPWLVEVLAHYIADRYPDEFRMLIYDSSFPEEVRELLGSPFDPNGIPGIELAVHEDPTHEIYLRHVEERRPGIVGFGFEPESNRFSVSRSFGFHEAPEGWPVDLVATDLDAFGPERVWNTFLRWEPERWGLLTPEWIPFEVLIVLVPLHEPDSSPGTPDQPGGNPGNDPGDDPGDPFDPGTDPGGEPGTGPGGYPGGEPGDPFDPELLWPCCLPDGSCSNLSVEECQRLDGTSNLSGAPCERLDCSTTSRDPSCAAVEGEITDICYTYESGILKVFASYAVTNKSSVPAEDITIYALVGLNDGVNGLGGGPECQDWQYGIDIPGGSTYTFNREFSTNAPTLDLDNLTYLYGSLWLQVEAPWNCWPITKQSFVQTWNPAPLCNPLGDGEPGTRPSGSPDLESTGACCLPDGTCNQLDETECSRLDGLFYGPGVDCSEIRCFPAADDPCPIIYSEVTEMCQLYQGPNDPMIVKATFVLRNPGTEDAVSVEVRLMAGGPLESNLQIPYKDEYALTIPVIPAGGSKTLTQTFTISPAPPQQPATTAALVFAAPITPLCKPKIQSAIQLFNLKVLQAGEGLCPTTDNNPPGGGEDGSTGACCLPDGSCQSLDETACARQGGEFFGVGSSCARITCEPSGDGQEPEPEPDPEPTGLPNLWVTNMTGCWTWSNDGQEHVVATVTGVVHNGGQASASNVRARIAAGGKSTTVTVGTMAAGSTKTVSATIDVGAYDLVSWPVSTSITADPYGAIPEADESNNTTHSSFPQSSGCP